MKNHNKNTPYLWPKKSETYSSSNAMAQNFEEEVLLNCPSIIKRKEAKSPRKRTDREGSRIKVLVLLWQERVTLTRKRKFHENQYNERCTKKSCYRRRTFFNIFRKKIDNLTYLEKKSIISGKHIWATSRDICVQA